ncbi:glyoxylate/hydroxypyruvate reductase A HPR2-like [Hibiscus syriacus]|uniref:Glyoxylate/hydroxypyruvate reductase A HPR2-like n=1 Tax=Hibiscus syriacus TaxID=106335 RepID=A0A6A2XSR5_HIBSY|nr:glyoxylate/hydroxypyruvate reductase A HPR2-like [Hibiscus syriacus]
MDQTKFYYLLKDAPDFERRRKDDKWWLSIVTCQSGGVSEAVRKNLKVQKECVTQVLKAAMTINAQLLLEMDIPESYIESLPKNGRDSLSDSIYKSITDEFFDPDHFLSRKSEIILHLLKERFPGLPQSSLDISKIEYNKDVGKAVPESYSRILKNLTHSSIPNRRCHPS